MKYQLMIIVLLVALFTSACDRSEDIKAVRIEESDFEQYANGWVAEFTEYGQEQEVALFEFDSKLAKLPMPLDTKKQALMMQSHNRSDDVFMFLKKKVTGLKPNRTYQLSFEIDLGTDVPMGLVGIGGAPAEAVYLKVGASPTEPEKKLINGFYEVTIDKGIQSTDGTEMAVIGNVGNDSEEYGYKLVKRSNLGKPISIKANQNGELWLCVGTDSGFEGLTVLYYDRIKVAITE